MILEKERRLQFGDDSSHDELLKIGIFRLYKLITTVSSGDKEILARGSRQANKTRRTSEGKLV